VLTLQITMFQSQGSSLKAQSISIKQVDLPSENNRSWITGLASLAMIYTPYGHRELPLFPEDGARTCPVAQMLAQTRILNKIRNGITKLTLLIICIALAMCMSAGPILVSGSRTDYNVLLRQADDQQMLLNLVLSGSGDAA